MSEISDAPVTGEGGAVLSQGITEGGGEQITGTPAETRWYDDFSPSAQKAIEAKGLPDMNALVNDWQAGQSLIGSSVRIPTESATDEQRNAFYDRLTSVDGVVRIPGEDASPEVLDAYYAKIGRPSEADGYRWDTPEDLYIDPESESGLKQVLYENGASQQLGRAVHDWLANNIAQEQNSIQQEVDQGMEALKSEWGQAYDHKMAVARGAVKELTSEGFMDYLDNSGLGNHPELIKAFAGLGERIGEPQSESPQSPSYKTPADLQYEIEDLMHPDSDYWQGNQSKINKVNELMRLKQARSG